MLVPLPLAVPAAAAGLAYLNARGSIWYDKLLITASIRTVSHLYMNAFRGRVNVFYILENLARAPASANRRHLLFENKSYTYAEAYENVLRYGTWFREKMGVQKGDVVAMDFENSDTFIFCWMGLFAIGAVPAFINCNLRGKGLAHCVNIAKSKVMLVDRAVADAVDGDFRAQIPGVEVVVHSAQVEAEILGMDPVRYPDTEREEKSPEAMAILIFTSGTTGLPKAAVLAWKKIYIGATLTSKWVENTPEDVYYTSMPLYHTSACVLAYSNCLFSGSTIALGRKFSTKAFWQDVRKYDATIIQYVGETCRYLLAAPPQVDPVTGENLDKKNRVRVALGNGLRPDIWNKFKERFGIDAIAEFYTSTESAFAVWNVSKNDSSMGGVGRVGWLTSLITRKITVIIDVDPETSTPIRDSKTGLCRRTPHGSPGEMLFQLPSSNPELRFQGYYGNKEASKSKMIRNVLSKGDVYFRTGDLMSTDGQIIYFVDRLGDTFRWKSENVSTMEVAHAVHLHADVQEANVYGVQLPHHDGRAGCAAVVLAGEPTPAVLESLAQHVRKELPKYAVPLFLRLQKNVGTNLTGTIKHQKQDLREQGVDPAKTGGDELYWLKDGTYVKFGPKDWDMMSGGQVKL